MLLRYCYYKTNITTVDITVQDTKFQKFHYPICSVLHYYVVNSVFVIKNSTISDNIGGSIATHVIFYIELFKPSCATSTYISKVELPQFSYSSFLNYKFEIN